MSNININLVVYIWVSKNRSYVWSSLISAVFYAILMKIPSDCPVRGCLYLRVPYTGGCLYLGGFRCLEVLLESLPSQMSPDGFGGLCAGRVSLRCCTAPDQRNSVHLVFAAGFVARRGFPKGSGVGGPPLQATPPGGPSPLSSRRRTRAWSASDPPPFICAAAQPSPLLPSCGAVRVVAAGIFLA